MRRQLHIVGLGPAGILAAHRAASRPSMSDLHIVGWDPEGPNLKGTLCCFRRQLPTWFPDAAIAQRCTVSVEFDSGRLVLDDDYLVISPQLSQLLGGYEVRQERWPDAPDGETVDTPVLCCMPRTKPMTARQFAIGVIIPEDALPRKHRYPVMMDWTAPEFADAAASDDEVAATFSYRIPVGNGQWLIQETVLATEKPWAEVLPYLEAQLAARLQKLDVDGAQQPWPREVVDFPLGPEHVVNSAAVFSSQHGWMHPATGYSFGALAEDVDRMLDEFIGRLGGVAVNGARGQTRRKGLRPLSRVLTERLHRIGLALLLSLSPVQTRQFFECFFALGPDVVRNYLITTDPTMTAKLMFRLWLRLLMKHPELAWKCVRAACGF